MGFTIGDRHLIKCLRVSKGHGATRLCKMFPDRQCNVDGVKTLIKKIDMTGNIDRQRGSSHPRSARTSTKLRSSHSAKKINHRTSPTLSMTFRHAVFRCELCLWFIYEWRCVYVCVSVQALVEMADLSKAQQIVDYNKHITARIRSRPIHVQFSKYEHLKVYQYFCYQGWFYVGQGPCAPRSTCCPLQIQQESPADARVMRDSSSCIPPSWIFEIRKLHH